MVIVYGIKMVSKVDKLIGFCSIYGVVVKRLLFGIVDVGLLVGFSEFIVLVDEIIDFKLVVLDLLIEVEYGFDLVVLLVIYFVSLVEKVLGYLGEYLEKFFFWCKKFCEDGLGFYGGILFIDSL